MQKLNLIRFSCYLGKRRDKKMFIQFKIVDIVLQHEQK
jgi:hypothetical protein